MKGIGDPNFILLYPDGSFLVSDDATSEIFLANPDGNLEIICKAVNSLIHERILKKMYADRFYIYGTGDL